MMNFTIIHTGKEPKIGSDYIMAGRVMEVKNVEPINKNKFKVSLIETNTRNSQEKRWLIKKKAVKS